MFHFTDELVSTTLLADRYRTAERAYLLQSLGARDNPSRAVLVRIGHLLVGLGHRLEALDARCASAIEPSVETRAAVSEC